MVIETIGLSLLIGKLRGGMVRNLEYLYIKGWYLFVGSFLIEIISLLAVTKTKGNLNFLVENNFANIHIIIYIFLIAGLAMNWNSIGLRITLIGSLLNFFPIAMNNGKMPVSINSLAYSELYTQLSLLEEGRILTHTLISTNTKLPYLGDIIPIPKPYIFPKIISIGDVFISLGIFILIQIHMKKSWNG